MCNFHQEPLNSLLETLAHVQAFPPGKPRGYVLLENLF